MVVEQMLETKDKALRLADGSATPRKDEPTIYDHLYKSEVQQFKMKDRLAEDFPSVRGSQDKRLLNRSQGQAVIRSLAFGPGKEAQSGRHILRDRFLSSVNDEGGASLNERRLSAFQAKKENKNLQTPGRQRLGSRTMQNLGLGVSSVRKDSANNAERPTADAKDFGHLRHAPGGPNGRRTVVVTGASQIIEDRGNRTDWFVNIINSLDKKLKEIKVHMKKK